MIVRSFLGLLALLASMASMASVHAQAEVEMPNEGLRVSATLRWPEGCSKGYVPVEIVLENPSAKPQAADLELSSYGDATSTRSLVAPPGRSELTLLFPAYDRSGNAWRGQQINLSVSQGLTSERSSGLGRTGHNLAGPLLTLVVLTRAPSEFGPLDPWIEHVGLEVEPGHVTFSHLRGKKPQRDLVGTVVSFARAPVRFEAYTSLDAVIVDTSDGQPPREALDAILRWARLGGVVLFAGPDATATLQRVAEPWFEDRFAVANVEPDDATAVAAGLGMLAAIDLQPPLLEGDELGQLFRWATMQQPSSIPERDFSGENTMDIPFDDLGSGPEIPGLVRIPYRTLTIGLLLFTLLIAPINFLIVRRLGRPVLLVLTIPAIALFASLAILGFGFFTAGIDSRTSEYTMTVLDQRTHRASSVQLRSLWCGLSPAGLRPGDGAAVFPSQADKLGYETRGFLLDETDGLLLTGDFLPVRRQDQQTVVSDQPFRGRVAFEREGAGWRITNGLGSEIDVLVYADSDGRRYALEGALSDGAATALMPLDDADVRSPTSFARTLRLLGYPDGPSMVAGLEIEASLAGEYRERIAGLPIPPGAYLAISDSATAAIDDLGIETEPAFARHVVLGIVDGEGGL